MIVTKKIVANLKSSFKIRRECGVWHKSRWIWRWLLQTAISINFGFQILNPNPRCPNLCSYPLCWGISAHQAHSNLVGSEFPGPLIVSLGRLEINQLGLLFFRPSVWAEVEALTHPTSSFSFLVFLSPPN